MTERVCSVSSAWSGLGHLGRGARALFFFLFLSAYHFLISFPFQSFSAIRSCIGLRAGFLGVSSRPMFIFLPVQASKGDIFVVLWEVALYCLRKWGNWVFQLNSSTVVTRIYLFRVRTKRSASPFASGHKGVILLCLKPDWVAKSLKSCPWNGGPLSVLTMVGYPCLAKIILRRVMTTFADNEGSISTLGNRWRLADTPQMGRDLQSSQRF